MSAIAVPENPFSQDVEQPLPVPTTLVIFGATGDLAARKLLPAIYNLGLGGLLPERFQVIGIGRSAGDPEEFRRAAREAIAAHSRTGIEGMPGTRSRRGSTSCTATSAIRACSKS